MPETDYVRELRAVRWREEPPVGSPTVVSTFAGCGGSSLGYRMAGFRELLAIDFDENAVATFARNFPGVPVWRRDITKVTAEEVLSFCGVGKGDVDVFDGSPPCQGFSTAGKRQVGDPRNSLFRDFVRLIEGIGPRVFVMENVVGQSTGRMRGVFIEIMQALKATGYAVRCAQMDAACYGVPQQRRRLIYVGVRPDVGAEPSFPRASARRVTVLEAIGDLEDHVDDTPPPPLSGNARANRMFSQVKEGLRGADTDEGGAYFNCRRLDRLRPSYTLLKTHMSVSGMIHYNGKRWITISEAKRLASFPDDFEFVGTYQERWARIGNAVMPLFMRALAENIRREILRK